MPSKQIRILQEKLAENLSFLSGRKVVIITSKQLQFTGLVVSAAGSGITLKNSRNRKLVFALADISELFTDEITEA
ncbi:MAG: hypothetical protein J0L62_07965 [Bacteroidetes bacterium]|nr:hypothetical protein [Bacteroidota bacterium]